MAAPAHYLADQARAEAEEYTDRKMKRVRDKLSGLLSRIQRLENLHRTPEEAMG